MASFFRNKKKNQHKNKSAKGTESATDQVQIDISGDLERNVEEIKQALGNSDDLFVRDMTIQNKKSKLIYIYTLCDNNLIQTVLNDFLSSKYPLDESSSFNLIKLKEQDVQTEVLKKILDGYALLFIEGEKTPYCFIALGNSSRQVSEPITENVVVGSHVAFVENIQTNLFMIRKDAVSPHLVVKQYKVGKESEHTVAVVYLSNVADQSLVSTIEERITSIDVDNVFSQSDLVALIEDYTITPFPQVLLTERVDRTVGNIMEGRIALFMNGSPSAAILPVSFFAFMQAADDYNNRFIIASFYRIIRFGALGLAILLPAFYIALIGFHYEVVPQNLLFTVKQAVENIPTGPLIEALIVEVFIELIREGAIRLPTKIGPTIGIVGGLIIGDAIVSAGLVSNLMVVVVALTAISSFVIPSPEMSAAIRLIRFPFMFIAAAFGMIGIVAGLCILIAHLCKLRPFGVPYLTPLPVFKWKQFQDTIIRAPVMMENERPADALPTNWVRERFFRRWKKK